MDATGLRLRVGRTWRLNPAYREALLRLAAGGGALAEAEVLDVLAIEVDGVDLAAGVREDDVFRVAGDLARAAERLARGAPKASVTFGASPMELLLVRRGATLALTLVRVGPPPEVRVQDLEVDASAFFDAVRACLEEVLADLEGLAPALAQGPYAAAVTSTLRHLRGRRRRAPAADPDPTPTPPPRPAPRVEGPAGHLACDLELTDDGDHLDTCEPDAEGDLHSLLAPGRVRLRAGDRVLAVWEGPPFLAFRALVGEVRDLLSAWEHDEAVVRLHFGGAELEVDLSGRRISGPEGACEAPALDLAAALLTGALELTRAFVARAPAQGRNAFLRDLAGDAAELHAHCRQLLDGDLTARRPPRHGTLAPAADRGSARPLGPHRLRRLAWQRRWSFDAGPLLGPGLMPFGRRMLVAGEDGVFALDRATGAPAFDRPAVEALWAGPRRTDPVLLAGPMGLDLCTSAGATAWSAPADRPGGPWGAPRYLRAPHRLVLSLDARSVVAFTEADGTVAWRFVPPGARRCELGGGPGGVLVATDTGFAYALDPVDGRVRWRIRTGLRPATPPLPLGQEVALVGEAGGAPAVALADAVTGGGLRLHPLPMDDVSTATPFGGRLWIGGSAAGEAAVVGIRGGGLLRHLLPGLEGAPVVLPTRGRLFAADARGHLAAFDGRGTPQWGLAAFAAGEAPGPARLAVARGVLVAARERVLALDAETGDLLGHAELPPPFAATSLVVDDHLGLFVADAEGAVHAASLSTHLSLVGG